MYVECIGITINMIHIRVARLGTEKKIIEENTDYRRLLIFKGRHRLTSMHADIKILNK